MNLKTIWIKTYIPSFPCKPGMMVLLYYITSSTSGWTRRCAVRRRSCRSFLYGCCCFHSSVCRTGCWLPAPVANCRSDGIANRHSKRYSRLGAAYCRFCFDWTSPYRYLTYRLQTAAYSCCKRGKCVLGSSWQNRPRYWDGFLFCGYCRYSRQTVSNLRRLLRKFPHLHRGCVLLRERSRKSVSCCRWPERWHARRRWCYRFGTGKRPNWVCSASIRLSNPIRSFYRLRARDSCCQHLFSESVFRWMYSLHRGFTPAWNRKWCRCMEWICCFWPNRFLHRCPERLYNGISCNRSRVFNGYSVRLPADAVFQ